MATITTTKPIDPSKLMTELGTASLIVRGGDPVSALSKEVEAPDLDALTLQAAVDAHSHAAPRYITKRAFMERFLDDEAVEIFTSRDPNVVKAYNRLMTHPGDEINLESPDTQGFVHYMESTALRADGVTKILAAGRAAAILG